MTPAIEVSHLVRKYGRSDAVNDLSLQVKDGEPMVNAGEHFPVVVKNGEPVGIPAKLSAAS